MPTWTSRYLKTNVRHTKNSHQGYSLSLENDPDPLSPITPGCLGPVTTLFSCITEQQHQPQNIGGKIMEIAYQ
jgi:hypothetical protein